MNSIIQYTAGTPLHVTPKSPQKRALRGVVFQAFQLNDPKTGPLPAEPSAEPGRSLPPETNCHPRCVPEPGGNTSTRARNKPKKMNRKKRHASAPPKWSLSSRYERQIDKTERTMRNAVFSGCRLPSFARQAHLKWGKSRMQQHYDALEELQELESGPAAEKSSMDTGLEIGA